jgi:3-hydroxyisobutyrate dehydrogenase-like beta-hydroxyacid dehydrogenase
MGRAMAGHIGKAGFDVAVHDLDAGAMAAAAQAGLATVPDIAALAEDRELFLLVVATDAQVEAVVADLLSAGPATGAVIVVAATIHPRVVIEQARLCAEHGVDLVDAPVCYGLQGALHGALISLCGGEAAAIARISPVLDAYSRSVEHVGGHGCGQIAKTCNNMMHWAACVANFETLALAKACGIDAQQMRETLLKCPARNTTLERWDTTRFTWHEKDMDIALDLAQSAQVPMPLFGAVDQLVKRLGPDLVADLLYGESTTYLGAEISARDGRAGLDV